MSEETVHQDYLELVIDEKCLYEISTQIYSY